MDAQEKPDQGQKGSAANHVRLIQVKFSGRDAAPPGGLLESGRSEERGLSDYLESAAATHD
jgi:hypothetical protein